MGEVGGGIMSGLMGVEDEGEGVRRGLGWDLEWFDGKGGVGGEGDGGGEWFCWEEVEKKGEVGGGVRGGDIGEMRGGEVIWVGEGEVGLKVVRDRKMLMRRRFIGVSGVVRGEEGEVFDECGRKGGGDVVGCVGWDCGDGCWWGRGVGDGMELK